MANPIQGEIAADASRMGIDPRWALAIGAVESGYNPNAVSSAGAIGSMQLMPQTARGLGVNPNIPAQNIQGGVDLLAQNLKRYGNPVEATEAYFGGTDPAKWGPKTRAYVQKVVKAYDSMAAPKPAQASGPIDENFIMSTMQAPAKNAPSAPLTSTGPIDESFIQSTMQTPKSAKAAPQPTTLQQMEAGAERGLHEITDVPAEALASGVGAAAHALGIASNWHPGAATAANDKAAAAKYQAQYGNAKVFSPANMANVGTQLAGGAAILGSGEGLLNAGADALPDTVAGNAARNATRFLTGRGGQFTGAGVGGAAAKVASLGAQGATQAAGFNALTGRPITPGTEVVGAVANPLLAGAAGLAGGAVRGLVDSTTPAATKAARSVGNALAADGVAPAEVVKQIGPNGDTLATVAGPNVRGMAENIANKPGEGRSIITNYFENLVNGHPEQMAAAIKAATGANGDIHDFTANVIQQRSQAAAPKFEKAFAQPISEEATAKLQGMLDKPRAQAAVKTAIQNLHDAAEANGSTFNPADYGIKIDENGRVQLIPGANSTPFLAAVKEGFDDNIEGMRDTTTGRLPNTKEVNNLDAIRSNFRNAVTDANPDYKAALDAWSGPSRVVDAARLGRKVFSTDSELTANRIKSMDPTEKAGFQAGVARAIFDKINQVQDGGKIARIFSRPDVRAKVAAAFDNPKEADRFISMAERMNEQANAKNAITGNSATARRAAEAQHDWSATARDAVSNTLTGRPHYAGLALLRGLFNHAQLQGNPAMDREVANLLTNPNAADVANALTLAQPGIARRIAGAAGSLGSRSIRLAPQTTYDAGSARR